MAETGASSNSRFGARSIMYADLRPEEQDEEGEREGDDGWRRTRRRMR